MKEWNTYAVSASDVCDACDDLQKYLDGDLGVNARGAFEQHLAGCPGCAHTAAGWSEFSKAARLDAARVSFRSAAAEHIAQRQLEASFVRQRTLAPWRKPSVGLVLAAAAVGLLIAGVGIYWNHSHVPSPKSVVSAGSGVRITRFSMDGSVRQTIARQGAIIAAAIDEQLLASVGKDQVAVGPGGRMVIQDGEAETTQLALDRGWIACAVSKRSGDRQFVTRTQDQRFAVVVKGTRFGVQYLGNRESSAADATPLLQVAVTEGVVQVEESQGRTWLVHAAEQLVVEIDGTAEVMPVSEQNRIIVTSLLTPAAAPSLLTHIRPQTRPTPQDAPGKSHDSLVYPKRAKPGIASTGQGENQPPEALEATTVSVAEVRQWIGAGRADEAIRVIEAKLLTDGANSELWRLLAESKRKTGDYQGAIAAYQRVIDSAPAQVANAARYRIGLIYQNELKQPANAITEFSRYLAEGEPQLLRAEALYHLARAEYTMGQKASARTHLREVVEQHGATAAAVQARKLLQQITP